MINPLLTFLRTLTKRNFSTNIAEISQLLKGSEIVLLSLPALVAISDNLLAPLTIIVNKVDACTVSLISSRSRR